MPRQNRRRAEEPAPKRPAPPGAPHTVTWGGIPYLVRNLSGGSAGAPRSYRCPGCDHEIRSTLAHVVAWPEHDDEGADRRHWHTACWAARDTRRPPVERSRNAPRYG